MFRLMLLAGIGGFIGSSLRFLVNKYCSVLYTGGFPLGTFVVNIIGCFLIGLLFGLIEKHNLLTSQHSALLITGFCGGFTTFSTFANEVWILGTKHAWGESILYLLLTILLGIFFVCAGRAVVNS